MFKGHILEFIVHQEVSTKYLVYLQVKILLLARKFDTNLSHHETFGRRKKQKIENKKHSPC